MEGGMGKTKCISILPMGKCREHAKWLVEKNSTTFSRSFARHLGEEYMYQIFIFARQMEVLVVTQGFRRQKGKEKKEILELFERDSVRSFSSIFSCERRNAF